MAGHDKMVSLLSRKVSSASHGAHPIGSELQVPLLSLCGGDELLNLSPSLVPLSRSTVGQGVEACPHSDPLLPPWLLSLGEGDQWLL